MCWFWWLNFRFWGWSIMGIIGFGILILFSYLIYKSLEKRQQETNRSDYVSRNDRSLEILKERFAKGEISEQEYEKVKKLLSQ